jgi:catechol 2,3-dioxygenase-like lactoylglutathione lyase family enzyme
MMSSTREDEAHHIDQLKERLARAQSRESHSKATEYSPRPNDVLIATTSKAGTTWMLQICHQLRSGGDMSFDEIGQVIPWLEVAHDQGVELESPQWGHPNGVRLFKTHWWADDRCPPFPKIIVVFRDPSDVLLSFYQFLEGWYFDGSEISLEAFAESYLNVDFEDASCFLHLASYYDRRKESGLLITFFEDLKENLPREVERVAKFLSSDSIRYDTPELIKTATEQSTYQFMKLHQSQFRIPVKKLRSEQLGLDAKEGHGLVRDGLVGAGSILPPRINEKILEIWTRDLLPLTGCASHGEFRELMVKERFH